MFYKKQDKEIILVPLNVIVSERGRFRIIRHLFGTWKTKCYESDNIVQFVV